MGAIKNFTDRLTNVMSGLGTSIDRRTAASYVFNAVTPEQAEAAYRTSWLVRKIVDIPPLDMTREWRDWQADSSDIEALEKEEKRLQLRAKCKRALILARMYGGAALYLGTGDSNPSSELNPEKIKVGGLKFVHVLSAQQLTLGPQNLDPESPWFNRPAHYELQAQGRQRVQIHPSRIVDFIGQPAPEGSLYQRHVQHWGDPIMQSIGQAVRDADTALGGFAALIDEAKLDILKMPGLTDQAQTPEGEARILNRLAVTAMGKSTWRALMLDGEDEWQQRQITWSGIPDVISSFLNVVAGAADIPVTRLLGQSPAGLASTGEGERLDYQDMVKARQDELLAPALDGNLGECLIRSALGKRPEEIYYLFAPLSELSEKDAGAVEKQAADTIKTYGDTGLIPEAALAAMAKNRIIESGRWPGSESAFEDAEAAGELAPKLDPEVKSEEAAAAGVLAAANENEAKAVVGKAKATGKIGAAQADALMLTIDELRDAGHWESQPRARGPGSGGGKWIAGGGSAASDDDFSQSKIVDANGNLLTVYHGTKGDFQSFDPERVGAHDFGASGRGFYFSEDKPTAGLYAQLAKGDGKPKVLAAQINAINPFELNLARMPSNAAESEQLTSIIRGNGHDAIIVRAKDGSMTELIVFEAKQIRLLSDDPAQLGDRYNPNQPRDPGGEGGGRWIPAGAGAANEGGAASNAVPLDKAAKEKMASDNEGKDVDTLRLEAGINQVELAKLGGEMQEALGVKFVQPPAGFEIKSAESINRKVTEEAYDGAHQLRDISRASFIVDNPQQAESIIGALAARGQVFDRGWTRDKQSGYIGRFVYLQHPNGGVSEIQLVPQGVAQLKMGANLQSNGIGHELYEVMRKTSNPMEARRAAARRSRKIYNRAMPRAFHAIAALLPLLGS